MAKVTLQSIADRVGVSRMTVSNAFSRPDQLSAELRERVLAAAAELGYVGPDPAARALARGRTGSVGLLINGSLSEAFEDAVSAAFLASVSDELAGRGMALTLLPASSDDRFVPARDVAVDGALVYICDPTSSDIDWLDRRGVPMVVVDHNVRDGVASVNVDDRGGARAAAQHLLDLGHRRVGIVTLETEPDALNHPARERMLGWHDALDPAGVSPTVVTTPYLPPGAAEDAARSLLDRDDRPTAVVCFSDAFAIGTIRAAESLGIRVPDDLSVVGFDDSVLAAASRPPLTTVHQEVGAKGRAAVAAIVGLMSSTPQEPVLLPTELVVRESTAPPPGERTRSGRDEEDLVAPVGHAGVLGGEVLLGEVDELVLVGGLDRLAARAGQPGLHASSVGPAPRTRAAISDRLVASSAGLGRSGPASCSSQARTTPRKPAAA